MLLLVCQIQRLFHKLMKVALGEGFSAVIYCFRVTCSICMLVVNSTYESQWNVKPLLKKLDVHSFRLAVLYILIILTMDGWHASDDFILH